MRDTQQASRSLVRSRWSTALAGVALLPAVPLPGCRLSVEQSARLIQYERPGVVNLMVDKRLSTTPHIRQHTVRHRSFPVSSEIHAQLVGRNSEPLYRLV